MRGAYTALATAHMLSLDKATLAKQAGVVQYVCQCQVGQSFSIVLVHHYHALLLLQPCAIVGDLFLLPFL